MSSIRFANKASLDRATDRPATAADSLRFRLSLFGSLSLSRPKNPPTCQLVGNGLWWISH